MTRVSGFKLFRVGPGKPLNISCRNVPSKADERRAAVRGDTGPWGVPFLPRLRGVRVIQGSSRALQGPAGTPVTWASSGLWTAVRILSKDAHSVRRAEELRTLSVGTPSSAGLPALSAAPWAALWNRWCVSGSGSPCGSREEKNSHGERGISNLVEEMQISSEREGVGLLKLPQDFVIFLALTFQLAHV